MMTAVHQHFFAAAEICLLRANDPADDFGRQRV